MTIVATKKEFRDFCRHIISIADYDVGKGYNEETAECPEDVEELLMELENFGKNTGFWEER